jgi:pimeloyl-ACP methyl ester carboxylesterase
LSFLKIQSQIIGTGKPIVLLHAFPLSHLIWRDLQPPPGYKLILPDFPGFGLSPLAKEGLTLEAAAKGLEKHLEELCVNEPFVLGGISMGGYWAMDYMRQFPEKIQSLILISTRPGQDKPENRMKRLEISDRVLKEGPEFLVDLMVPGLLGQSTRKGKPEVVNSISQWIRETDPKAIALAQRAMADRRDQTVTLNQFEAPTLIMAGKEDNLIPFTEAEAMSKQMNRSQVEFFDQVGHLVPLEGPKKFQTVLNQYLSLEA